MSVYSEGLSEPENHKPVLRYREWSLEIPVPRYSNVVKLCTVKSDLTPLDIKHMCTDM